MKHDPFLCHCECERCNPQESMNFTIDRDKLKYAAHCGHCGKDFINAKDVLDHILDVKKRERIKSDI